MRRYYSSFGRRSTSCRPLLLYLVFGWMHLRPFCRLPGRYALYQDRLYVTVVSGFCIPLLMVQSINHLPPSSDRVSKPTAGGKLTSLQMLAAPAVTWVVDESDQCVIADAVADLGLPIWSKKATLSVPHASPGVFVDVLDVHLDAKGNQYLSDTPPSGVINIFPVCEGVSLSFKNSAKSCLLTLHPTLKMYLSWRYAERTLPMPGQIMSCVKVLAF